MIDEITKYVSKKVKDYEVYYNESEEINAEINNNKINFISEGETRSIGIRVAIDRKIGFSFTSNLDKYKECVENAIKLAKLNEKDINFRGFVQPKPYENLKILNKKTKAIDADFIHDFNQGFLNQVHSLKKETILSGASFIRDINTIHVVNSEGINFKETNSANAFQYGLTLKKDGKLESIELDNSGREPLKPEMIAKEAVERLLSILNRKQAPSMNCQLLLDPEALTDLMAESYAYAINAENVQQRKSYFQGKLGKKVFDEKISIKDDGLTKGLFCTRSCDCEGTPSQQTLTIQNGTLKNFLYDNYTADKDNKESTGNAYRSTSSLPSISTNNVIMEEGNSENILSEVKRGIYVKGLLGVHTMNEATGDFSLSVLEGHYVENGEIKYPVKDTMIAGNFFTLMQDVQSIGKISKEILKRATFSGQGGYYLPEVLFPKINVIGN